MSSCDPFELDSSVSKPIPCDVFVESEARSGTWNMAIDAALLERCMELGRCHLRLYRWSEPTLSLGYFQKDVAEIPVHLSALPRVRRLTGGGAILHHRELTYSCTIPAGHPLARNPVRLYDTVHEGIIAVLEEFGWSCRLRGNDASAAPGGPFLCFARGDARDVLFGEHKIVGSAQRRRRGAVLQHGSLLLRQSEFAPEFPGLYDVSAGPQAMDSVAFQQHLAEVLGSLLGDPVGYAGLTAELASRAAEIGGFR